MFLNFFKLPLHSQTQREFSSAGSEHLPYKQRVGGSNPSTPTRKWREIGIIQSLFCFYMCQKTCFLPHSTKNQLAVARSRHSLRDLTKLELIVRLRELKDIHFKGIPASASPSESVNSYKKNCRSKRYGNHSENKSQITPLPPLGA